jgi:Mlc titration factor MtfA (ptsG expression regulator)
MEPIYYLVGAVLVLAILWAGARSRRTIRRKRLRARSIPPEWKRILETNLPLYPNLPEALKAKLHGHVQVFLAEKQFEGCGGLDLTDEMRVTIAGFACMLIINARPTYYPRLLSILVYPSAFITRDVEDEDGMVMEEEVMLGESWDTGAVILAWDEVLHAMHTPDDGMNIVYHEFAHQLDREDGFFDGRPELSRRSQYLTWTRVLDREFRRHQHKVSRGMRTVMDEYGASDPAEFFAVAAETFFEKPGQLKAKHPSLYTELKEYFRLDPAEW